MTTADTTDLDVLLQLTIGADPHDLPGNAAELNDLAPTYSSETGYHYGTHLTTPRTGSGSGSGSVGGDDDGGGGHDHG